MGTLAPLFAYFGPETVMPVASIIATVVGFLLMFGRIVMRFMKTVFFQWVLRPLRSRAVPQPHYRARAHAAVEATGE